MDPGRWANSVSGWLFLTPWVFLSAWLVALPGGVSAQDGADGLAFTSAPLIEQNPNPAVPLAAVLAFDSRGAVATRVDFADGERTWSVDFGRVPGEGEILPILGMRSDRRHEIRVTIFDSAATPCSGTVYSNTRPRRCQWTAMSCRATTFAWPRRSAWSRG